MTSPSSNASQPLELSLLGRPEIRINGAPLSSPPPAKSQALLFYLAATAKTLTRDALAGLFWGDMDEATARTNLRLAMSRLQKATGPCLTADRYEVACNFNRPVWTDFHDFVAVLRAPGKHEAESVRAALNLYRDEFLHDFPIADAPEFETWVVTERERLHRLAMDGLQLLLERARQLEQAEKAINLARRILALEPWHEQTHRQLMSLLAMTGQRSAALVHFEQCCNILEDELGVPPAPETVALYEEIRDNEFVAVATEKPPVAPSEVMTVEVAPTLPASWHTSESSRPFVGRSTQRGLLRAALQDAVDGRGQLRFITGGAGRGKSWLVQEFARMAQEDQPDVLTVSGYCSAQSGIGDPFLPFRQIVRQLTGDVRALTGQESDVHDRATALWRAMPLTLPLLMAEAPELVHSFLPVQPLLERASTVAANNPYWWQALQSKADQPPSPGQLEQPKLFVQMANLLAAIAEHRPLLILLEDLHWTDASSASLLFHLSRALSSQRILILGTYRPEEVDVGRQGEQHPMKHIAGEIKRQHGDVWLDLSQMEAAEARRFVDEYLDTEPNQLDDAFRTALYRQTGGHALFLVEVLRDLQNRGSLIRNEHGQWVAAPSLDWDKLPSKVEGIIEQRIGALDDELRTLLTLAAVEGEQFTAEVIAGVHGANERAVLNRLTNELARRHHLVEPLGLERINDQRLSRFRFRHQLFQQYLLQHLTESESAYLNEDVANALEALYHERAAEIAGPLVRHYQLAGNKGKTLHYLVPAAQQAHGQAANVEAADYARAAIDLLESVPDVSQRMQLELLFQITLGRAVMYSESYGSGTARRAFLRALEVCEQMGAISHMLPIVKGLYATDLLCGNFEAALKHAEHFCELAEAQNNMAMVMQGHGMMGMPLNSLGRLHEAYEQYSKLATDYNPERTAAQLPIYGMDEICGRLSEFPVVLSHLGDFDAALALCNEAVALAEQVNQPINLVHAHAFATWTLVNLNEPARAEVHAREVVELCNRDMVSFWTESGSIMLQWSLGMQGKKVDPDLMQRQIDRLRQDGHRIGVTWHYTYLAEILAAQSRRKDAFVAIEKGLALADEISDLPGKVQLLFVWGKLLSEFEDQAESMVESRHLAEERLRKAVLLAEEIGSRLLELRAAIALARLLQRQGRVEDAAHLLRPIYDWFRSGFNTAPLKEARQLLLELE